MYHCSLGDMLQKRESAMREGRSRRFYTTLKKHLYWFVPLICSLVFLLPLDGIPVSPDGAYYMGVGEHFAQKQRLLDLAHNPVYYRPLFPVILGLLFKFGVPALLGSFLLIRIFFVTNILLVALLGRILFTKYVGFLAAILVLTSYSLAKWSTWVNLDFVLATFILGYIYVTYLGFKHQQRNLFFVAGLVLGFGFLVKETASLFLTIPLLYGLVQVPNTHRTSLFSTIQARINRAWIAAKVSSLSHTLIVVVGFLLPISIWAGYVRLSGHDFRLIFGRSATDNFIRLTSVSSPATNPQTSESIFGSFHLLIWNAAINFYEWHLAPNFIVAPLFCVAVISLIVVAIRRQNAARYLLCALLCYLPLIALFGTLGHRSRQSIALYFLFYISLAYILVLLATACINKTIQVQEERLDSPREGLFGRLLVLVGCLPILIVLCVQLGWDVDGNIREHLSRFNSITALSSTQAEQKIRLPEPWWPTAQTVRAVEGAAQWLQQENKEGKHLRILGIQNDNRYLNLATDGQHAFYQLRHTATRVDRSDNQHRSGEVIQFSVEPLNAIFTTQATKQEQATHYNFLAYTQNSLLKLVEEKQIDYIIVGHPQKWLANYFTNHPAFVKQAEFEFGTLQVYHVLSEWLLPIDIPTTVDPQIHRLLNLIQAHRPDRIPKLKEDFAHFDPNWQSLLFFNDASELPNNSNLYAFGYGPYGRWNSQTGNLDNAMAVAKKKHRENPDNPWPLITLAALAETQGRVDVNRELLIAAVELYQKALSLDPENWRAPWALLELYSKYPEAVHPNAIEAAIKALKLRTVHYADHPRAFRELAVNYRRLGRLEEAEQAYLDAINNKAVDGSLYLSLGWFYETTGDPKAAIAAYREGLSITPRPTDEYRNLEERLEKLISKNHTHATSVTQ